MLNAQIQFKGTGYFIGNLNAPSFLRSYEFQDEYEANLAYASWLQFNKIDKEKTNYGTFQWILKAIFRVIGVNSLWAE